MRISSALVYLAAFLFTSSVLGQSINFDGSNDYVNLSNDATLQLTSFTLEAWIKPSGLGAASSTGNGGITATPIITKGRGEADAPDNVNMNYFLGLTSTRKLTADFEEGSGPNHPIVSKAMVPDNVWTHVAVSYEYVSSVWKLYINGTLDTTKDIGSNKKPANVSIQPGAIGSALNSAGTPAGFFKGQIDEVRIWNVVRTGSEILNNYKAELTSGNGLAARYGLNEGTGTTATNSISVINGTLINDPQWTTGQTFSGSVQTEGFKSLIVSSGWTEAVGLTFNKTGSQMFVWERPGKVWVVENNTKSLLLNISAEVGGYRDLGLLGFALHPDFDNNGYFYLFYTVDRHHLLHYGTSNYSPLANDYLKATIQRLTRYTATKTTNGYTVDTLTRKVLIGETITTGVPQVTAAHGPGSLLFGKDGTLLICTGDGAGYSSTSIDTGNAPETYYVQALKDGIITPQENVGAFRSQMLESYNGKILRIDPETGNGIPTNPFYDPENPNKVSSKVWALGLRNPFRISIKPGTGSTDPADGNPGILYIGDVGYLSKEELDVVTKPGMNFGWPIFEGLTNQTAYTATKTYNYNAPNPLYGVNGCTKEYFYFKDLIKQETANGIVTFTNSCNTTQGIPPGIKTFIHSRPIIDWGHGTGPSRTGIFNSSGAATTINIGATGSPVSGPQFGGSCAIGGVFYAHDDFPSGFQNSFIFADYTKSWIRNIVTDANDKPISVGNVIDSGKIVALATHPVERGLYYISFTSTIKKLTYNTTNRLPKAVASSNKQFGTAPLSVQFTGTASLDPEGKSLSYHWDFGDGTTSTVANPLHTFTAPSSDPINYKVLLTVADNLGATDTASLTIYLNLAPPLVNIISPVNNDLYSMAGDTTLNLLADVAGAEDGSPLYYEWQTILQHATHEHPEPIDTSRITTTTISPAGCDEFYCYRIKLKVTNAAGLSTTKEVRIYPDCNKKVSGFTLVNADTEKDIMILKGGETLNLATLPTTRLNIRTNTNPSVVGSVAMALSGAQVQNRTESSAPYALFGDTKGNYNSWTPAIGTYTVSAMPYDSSGGKGNVGTGANVSFTVINQSAATVQATKTKVKILVQEEEGAPVNYYPNPFEDQFTFMIRKKWQNTLPLKLYDVHGRMAFAIKDINENQTYILGRQLPVGLYIITVGTGSNVKYYKIVKTR